MPPARTLLCRWMRQLGLQVPVDGIGNIFGLRAGTGDLPSVMTGSYIDTVRNGGRYDGNYGVLPGLAVVQALNDADRRWPETYRVLGLQGVEMTLIGYNTAVHNPPAPEHDAR